MGKLDYLSKYTSKPKKSKKHASNIIATDDSLASEKFIDPENVVSGVKEPQGFKRIDNEEVKKKAEEPKQEQQQQTIYRDLTGRIIDISTVQKKPQPQVIRNQSTVQTTDKSFTISRTSKEYNDALKAKTSHEDPFKSHHTGDKLTYTKGVSIPNRFGIKAGVLWDGIDRSNGFEKLVMRKRTEAKASSMAEVDEYEMDYQL